MPSRPPQAQSTPSPKVACPGPLEVGMGTEKFQVDLHGVVDLLSNHLYSSPRVYLRELLQNAVDAITARRAVRPTRRGGSTYGSDGGRISISDTGIGLVPARCANCWRRSGAAPSATRSGSPGPSSSGSSGSGCCRRSWWPRRSRWSPGRPAALPRSGSVRRTAGTRSPRRPTATRSARRSRSARRGAEQWYKLATVVELIRLFGALLPIEITGQRRAGDGRPRAVGRHRYDATGRAGRLCAGQARVHAVRRDPR